MFSEAGYDTAYFGKWHLGPITHFPEHQGFDVRVHVHAMRAEHAVGLPDQG